MDNARHTLINNWALNVLCYKIAFWEPVNWVCLFAAHLSKERKMAKFTVKNRSLHIQGLMNHNCSVNNIKTTPAIAIASADSGVVFLCPLFMFPFFLSRTRQVDLAIFLLSKCMLKVVVELTWGPLAREGDAISLLNRVLYACGPLSLPANLKSLPTDQFQAEDGFCLIYATDKGSLRSLWKVELKDKCISR